MFNLLLPHRLDNTYRSSKLGLWVFALVVAFRAAQMEGVLVNGASILRVGHRCQPRFCPSPKILVHSISWNERKDMLWDQKDVQDQAWR